MEDEEKYDKIGEQVLNWLIEEANNCTFDGGCLGCELGLICENPKVKKWDEQFT